jgi:hypothetical protein
MGLDMTAFRTTRKLPSQVDFEGQHDDQELHHWRKHPNLHGWMERLYRSKDGEAESFNLVCVALTPEDIDALERAIREKSLPETSGFFFGTSNGSEMEFDLVFIENAHKALANGDSVYYSSWW